jgi:hypothetical protein
VAVALYNKNRHLDPYTPQIDAGPSDIARRKMAFQDFGKRTAVWSLLASDTIDDGSKCSAQLSALSAALSPSTPVATPVCFFPSGSSSARHGSSFRAPRIAGSSPEANITGSYNITGDLATHAASNYAAADVVNLLTIRHPSADHRSVRLHKQLPVA